MRKMQELKWIEEPRYAEDFEHLFDGENRNCNIRWIGKPLAILTELTKRLLEQSYMDKQKGVSASSIVQKQFGKNRSSNTGRLDKRAEEQIDTILQILDYNKELPLLRKENDEDIDIRDVALQDVYKKEMRIKKSCM